MKRKFCLVLCMLFALLAVTACGGPSAIDGHQPVTLKVYNWAEYIDESVIDSFEDQYPWITVNYDVYANNEEMLTQVENDPNVCDVAFPSDYIIEKMIKQDLLAKLDYDNLPNFKNVVDYCKNRDFDPGNAYSVPYMWGTVGILYNKTMVDEKDVQSWDVLWSQKYAKKIYMYDSVRDSMGVALKRLGYSMNTTDKDELNEARDSLIEQKPLVLAYVSDDVKDKMINNNGALAVVYSGDAVICMDENEDLGYVVPKEGSNLWFDNMVVLKSTKNKEAAELFINYLCGVEVATKNAEYIGYSTPIKGVADNLGADYKDNPVTNPPQSVLENCEVYRDLGDLTEFYNELWIEVKAS